MLVALLVADYDDVIVMNIIKFENFTACKHTIVFRNILCLTTEKMFLPPLNLDYPNPFGQLQKSQCSDK